MYPELIVGVRTRTGLQATSASLWNTSLQWIRVKVANSRAIFTRDECSKHVLAVWRAAEIGHPLRFPAVQEPHIFVEDARGYHVMLLHRIGTPAIIGTAY
jgi:hypothetical protein